MTADSGNIRSKLIRTATPGVFKRGSRYVVIYRSGGRQQKRTVDGYAEARRIKAEHDARRHDVRAGRMTFGEHAGRWIASERRRGTLRVTTLDDYERRLARWVLPVLGDRLLTDLRPPDVTALAARLLDHRNENGSRLSDATVKVIVGTLRTCLSAAVSEGLIQSNPGSGVRLRLGSPQRVRGVITEAEAARLLRAIPVEHRTLVELVARTGLRVSEALGLQWRDVILDSEGGIITIERAWVRGRLHAPKTAHGHRSLPIGADLAAKLMLRHAATDYGTPDDFVFGSRNGQPLDPSNLRKRVLAPAGEACGLPGLGFHDLRHFVASQLFARHDAKTAQIMLGHHSASFTLARYVHLTERQQLCALPTLENREGCGESQKSAESHHPLRNTHEFS